MINVFYIPFGYGNSTEFLFKEAVKSVSGFDYSGILYLAPSLTKVKESQKIFHKVASCEPAHTVNKCYIPPEMATIRQYCKKTYSAYGDKRVIERRLVPVIISMLSQKGLGFSALIADFISNLKQLFPGDDIDSLKQRLSNALHELNIPETVSGVVMDCMDIFRKYQGFINDRGLIDEEDLMNYIGKQEDSLSVASYRLMILDGFYDITPSERNVLRTLLQNSGDALIAVPYGEKFKDLAEGLIDFLKSNFEIEEAHLSSFFNIPDVFACYPFNSIEEEVEGIARNIKSLYVSGKFRDLDEIIVAFPDLSQYSSVVERVFRRYGIPCDISIRKPMVRMRPILDLICLLHSVADGYPRLKFSQFLSSGYFVRIPDGVKKWMSILSLQSGIISGRNAWLGFVSEGSEIVDTSALKEQVDIQEGLKWVFEKLEPLEKISHGAPLDVHIKKLEAVLDDLGFLGAHQDEDMKDLLKAAKEIFEQISFLVGLHRSPVALTEFIEILGHIFNASYTAAEEKGVRVMDFSEAYGLSPEYIYFGGLTDGDMPKRPDTDHLLPDSVKKKLGFLNLDKYIDIQKFNFYKLISSCGKLHLSYPLMEGDDMFLPSSFLYFGQEIKERIPGVFSMDELLIRSGKKLFSEHIFEIEARPSAFVQKSSFLRVTDIDSYRTCRRKFFIERILNLRPMNVKEYEIEAATLGTIIHKIMERLIKEPFDNMDALKKRAEEIITEIMKDKRIDGYWKNLIKDTFIEILPDIYEKELEIRNEEYISTEVEKTITGEPIKGIRLKGKIDRFDKIGDSVQIIDYKTGGAGLNCKQVMEGNENLQLFLYAAVMKNQGYKVDRVGIYSLKDIQIKWCPPKRTRRQKSEDRSQTIDDYIIASLRFLEEAVKDLRNGNFTAKPINDYICWSCHEQAFCPYIQQ
ncbi:MAG: PD-(D/E)XK nuclease family protein [Thermodesulfovibrionales bacterium]|nr:PD-(D/E)XK nuclease family protein [Thermodesulfovibrionales bacterium]